MKYYKLDYEQYFIDTSNDTNHTGKARFKIKYNDITYKYADEICHANYEVHYEVERNVIQINFQQTVGFKDWFVNFMFLKEYYDSFYYNEKRITLKVHNGWAEMYKAMKHNIRNEVTELLRTYPKAYVEVVGWSLGSAMAQLCAQDLNFNFGIRPHLYTYGSVNPFKINLFNRKKIKRYLNDCCEEVYNFSHKSDIVTYLVPRIFGFIKMRRVNLGTFHFLGLFNPMKNHTCYDQEELYNKIYEKERKQ